MSAADAQTIRTICEAADVHWDSIDCLDANAGKWCITLFGGTPQAETMALHQLRVSGFHVLAGTSLWTHAEQWVVQKG